ncbi:hypothetical protein ACHAP5_005032 [Fusarium lateritium]
MTNGSNSSNVTNEPRENLEKEEDCCKRSSNVVDDNSLVPSKRRRSSPTNTLTEFPVRRSQVPPVPGNSSKGEKAPVVQSQPTRISLRRARSQLYPEDPEDDKNSKEIKTVKKGQDTRDLTSTITERPRRKAARLSLERTKQAYSEPFGSRGVGLECRPKPGKDASIVAVAQETTESKANNEDALPSPKQRPSPTDEALPLRDDPFRCGNCSSATHSLDRCLKAIRGTIPGCPLCKVTGHLLEDCEKFPLANADPSKIVRLVVWDRGNMPAWETKVPWFKYLYFYMSTFEFFLQDRTFIQTAPLPWTEAYAREVAASTLLSNTQQNNDDTGSSLSDPQTANLTAA